MAKSLETFAMEWLRYSARCELLVNQRTTRLGVPDCLGVRKRFLIEVEIKRTLADFKLNTLKRHIVLRERGSEYHLEMAPRQFYFMVPWKLAATVTNLLPAWAGLLAAPTAMQKQEVNVIVRAPVNRQSERVSLKECVKLVSYQTNMVLAQNVKIDELKRRLRELTVRT